MKLQPKGIAERAGRKVISRDRRLLTKAPAKERQCKWLQRTMITHSNRCRGCTTVTTGSYTYM